MVGPVLWPAFPLDPCALGGVRAVFGGWVRVPPIFLCPGLPIGSPLWPANSGGPVGPLPCFPGSRRFIGGPLVLLVLCLCCPTVLAGFLRLFVFWTSPYLALSARSCLHYYFR